MSKNYINVSVSTGKPTRVSVSTPANQQNVDVTRDTSAYNAEIAKQWATSESLVLNEDYSAKHYAKEAKKSEQNAESFESATRETYNTFLESSANANNELIATRDEAITNIQTSQAEAIDSINSTKTTILNDIEFVADGEKKEIEDLIDTGKDELKEAIGDIKVLTTLKIGQIGIAPLGIDESLNMERYLNGQIIIQDQFKGFTQFLKRRIELYPSLACTEDEWHTTVTMSAFSQCGKFVIDDNAGTIRLPKVVNIQGLTDLSKLGEIVEAGLPNITGWFQDAGNQHATPYVGGAFVWSGKNGNPSNNGAASDGSAYTFDASRCSAVYGKSNTVQQEQIQYPYFIQVATGAEVEDNIINEIELNNPFSFGDSKHSPVALNNLSWLKSEGQWNSKATYPAYYDWILTNVNNGVKGFIGNTMYMWGSASGGYMCQTLTPKVGSPIWAHYSKDMVGYVTKVYDTGELDFTDNRNNVSYTKIGRYSPSDESSNAYITDYDFVLNTSEETFRLPLLDGSESLPSDKFDNLTLLASGSTYTAPANGWFVQNGASTGTNQRNVFVKNGILQGVYSSSASQTLNACVETLKGESIIFHYNITPSIFRFIYAQGNGSLYYYVGETVQNANLINAGRIEEKLVNKVDKDSSWGFPSSRYIDLTLGASGTTYTAPANGWFILRRRTTAVDQYVTFSVSDANFTTVCYGLSQQYSTTPFTTLNAVPVRKGYKLHITYNIGGGDSGDYFRFIYAEGEQ